jgi:4-carboxymuconolactone decarboxylase
MNPNLTQQELFDAALAVRKQVLGDDYVARAFAVDDAFSAAMQEHITLHAWGASWARRGPDGELAMSLKQRSLINLAMLSALNRSHELEIHLRGAIRNGVTQAEMLEVFLQVAVYCGAPALMDSVRIARKVWAEQAAPAA